jgi:cytochrome c oxidase subunit 3
MTIILAVVFTLFQYIEYTESSFSFADSVFGTTFYAATGLHGFHVIVGTIFIIIGFLRIINYNVTKQGHVGIETGILY